MRMVPHFGIHLFRPLLLGALLSTLPACDDGNDDDDFDYDPPAGYGALIVDNETASDVRVNIEDDRLFTVGDFDDKRADMRPGSYRLVLDEVDGDRRDSRYIDIVAGRNTVVEAKPDTYDFNDYDIDVYFN